MLDDALKQLAAGIVAGAMPPFTVYLIADMYSSSVDIFTVKVCLGLLFLVALAHEAYGYYEGLEGLIERKSIPKIAYSLGFVYALTL